MPRTLTDPLPAIHRIVSGRKKIMSAKTTTESIKRKTKIDLKPKELARMPPRTGPIAILKLRTKKSDCQPIYVTV